MQEALSGVRVLDLTINLPGPFMTWLMAEMGAEVLKVEHPDGGDFARAFTDPRQDGYFPVFNAVNRGKKSITADLKQASDRQRFLQLVETYSIVVEGFRPGVMKKLGLDYAAVSRRHPNVIYVSISGYGQTGSYAQKGGHDINYQALAGSFDTGAALNKPLAVPSVPLADIGGGSLLALSGLLAAVIQRNRTGKGCHLDAALYDGAFALNVFGFCQMQANQANNRSTGHFLSGAQPFYHIYETKDGRHMSLGALEPKFWITFCQTVERDDLIPRQLSGEEGIKQVAELFKTRTQAEWIECFRDVDACCEPVLTIAEVIDSDLGDQRGLVCATDDGTVTPACPIKTVNQPPHPAADVPALGEHNAILTPENNIARL
jgi:alpha-methylacyl-CoA racemase